MKQKTSQFAFARKVLKDVRARGRHLDGVLIETTGLADPSPIASTFFLDPFMQEQLGGHFFCEATSRFMIYVCLVTLRCCQFLEVKFNRVDSEFDTIFAVRFHFSLVIYGGSQQKVYTPVN